jgi:P2 family phage contractile tail tube protein
MALPKILKDFNLFGNGENWMGQVEEITLPKLTRKMEEYQGGGMAGPVEIDMGQEKIEMEWTAGGLIESVFDSYGKSSLDGDALRFTGAYIRDDSDETVAVEILVRGRHSEIDMGNAKRGDKNQLKVKTSCVYYKLSIAGKDVIEIDTIGYLFKVNGEDRMAERRKALGI